MALPQIAVNYKVANAQKIVNFYNFTVEQITLVALQLSKETSVDANTIQIIIPS